jgi:hypothetical protein
LVLVEQQEHQLVRETLETILFFQLLLQVAVAWEL